MEIKEGRSKAAAALAILFLLIAVCGCAALRGRTAAIKGDSLLKEKGYESVVAMKLRIIDRTLVPVVGAWGKVTGITSLNSWFGADVEVPELLDDYIPKWEAKDGVSYYEKYIIRQAMPGDLNLYKINVEKSGYGSIWWFNAFTDYAFDVPAGRLLYLGEVTLEFTGRQPAKTGNGSVYTYNIKKDMGRDGLERALQELRSSHPAIYGKFSDKVEIASPYLYYSDFNLLAETGDRAWTSCTKKPCEAYYDFGGFFVMEPADNLYHWKTKSPAAALPEDFEVELETRWLSGVKDDLYGLTLGKDADSLYHFDISGSGAAMVWKSLGGKRSPPDPIPLKQKAVAESDGSGSNTQRVVKKGRTISYFVNGVLVGEFDDTIGLGGERWAVGISVANKQKVAFRKLVVRH